MSSLAVTARARGGWFRAWALWIATPIACVSDGAHELAPRGANATRERGSFIGRRLAENAANAPRTSRPAPAPLVVAWTTPFGQPLPYAPIVHRERSVEGRELCYWVLGDGAETVLLLGVIHGDERSSTEAAYDLLAHVCAEPAALAGITLVIAPEVNPDGNASSSRRNARAVDLNRNFPARNWHGEPAAHGPGPSPASEPETRFVLELLDTFAPARVIATHAAAACVNWDGPAAELAERMSRECGLPVAATIGYPTPGSLGSLLGNDRELPTITFELATKESVGAAQESVRRALLAGLRPAAAEAGAVEASGTPWFNERSGSR